MKYFPSELNSKIQNRKKKGTECSEVRRAQILISKRLNPVQGCLKTANIAILI